MQGMQVAAGAAFAPPYATECAMTLVAIGGSQFANVKIEMADVVVE